MVFCKVFLRAADGLLRLLADGLGLVELVPQGLRLLAEHLVELVQVANLVRDRTCAGSTIVGQNDKKKSTVSPVEATFNDKLLNLHCKTTSNEIIDNLVLQFTQYCLTIKNVVLYIFAQLRPLPPKQKSR